MSECLNDLCDLTWTEDPDGNTKITFGGCFAVIPWVSGQVERAIGAVFTHHEPVCIFCGEPWTEKRVLEIYEERIGLGFAGLSVMARVDGTSVECPAVTMSSGKTVTRHAQSYS